MSKEPLYNNIKTFDNSHLSNNQEMNDVLIQELEQKLFKTNKENQNVLEKISEKFEKNSQKNGEDLVNFKQSSVGENKLNFEIMSIKDDDIRKVKSENLELKKRIIKLSEQNYSIISELENIIKISNFESIDITTKGIRRLDEIVKNNKEILGNTLDELHKAIN